MAVGFEEIGDGVFRRRYAALDQNIGLVVGGDGALILDTRSLPKHAHELAADVAAVTSQPVRWVVNSHWHWDHVLGNSVFATADLWGHQRCREVMLSDPDGLVAASRASFGDLANDLTTADVVPPANVFTELATLDLGDRSVELLFRGKGHTDSDVVVVAGDVLFAGDLLEEGAPPYFGDGYPSEWPATVERHLKPEPRVVVPGHGDVMTLAAASDQLDQLSDVAARCAAAATEAELELAGAPFPDDVMLTAFARDLEVR